jgi:predicted ArsR family transcriptional regulator
MKKSLVLGAAQGSRLAVLELIKRSGEGLCVKDLSVALGMSYMGVKAHCIALASSGHLKTWRDASAKGRPRLLYKLADTGEQFFIDEDNDLSLDLLREAVGLYGSAAPRKLLFMVFRSLQGRYRKLISGVNLQERINALVRIRDQEGRMCSLIGTTSWEIHESHNPLSSVMREYPEMRALEENAIGEVLGVPVKRREEGGKVIFSPRL